MTGACGKTGRPSAPWHVAQSVTLAAMAAGGASSALATRPKKGRAPKANTTVAGSLAIRHSRSYWIKKNGAALAPFEIAKADLRSLAKSEGYDIIAPFEVKLRVSASRNDDVLLAIDRIRGRGG